MRLAAAIALLASSLALSAEPESDTGPVEFSPFRAVVMVGDSFFPVSQLIDRSGLSSGEPRLHVGAGGNWATSSVGVHYLATQRAPEIWFDMGADVEMDGWAVWAYTFRAEHLRTSFQANSVKRFTLAFATEADGPFNFRQSVKYAPGFTAKPPPTAGSDGVIRAPRQEFFFGRRITARYVRMTILSNHYGHSGSEGGDRVGLGEVAAVRKPNLVAAR